MPNPSSPPTASPTDHLLWRKLYDHLFARISSGELPDGAMLPTEMDLCEAHSVSRITVRRALRELEVLGLLKRQRGSGTAVVAPRVDDSLRLIHVVMSPTGHVLSDIHQALMMRLGALDCSHRTWGPEAASVDAIAAVPARGTIIVPWNIDTTEYSLHAARLGRVVAILPGAGMPHGLPGLGIDFSEPVREVLLRAREAGITSVIHVTYFHQSEQRDTFSLAVMQGCMELGVSFSVIARFNTSLDEEFTELRGALQATSKPVLLLCASDFIAFHTRKHVVAMQRKIPGEVSIVGVFDTPHSQAGDMSTIGVRPEDLVQGALDLIFNQRTSTAFTRLPGSVIIRGTGPGAAS